MTPDVWAVLDAADFAKKGMLPVGGGTLEQTAIGMAAIREVWNSTEMVEAELGRQSH